MKKFLRFALCFLVLSSVRSHIINYRKFRELDIPQGEQLILKQDELVQNLQKETSIPVTIEIIEPVAVLVDKPLEDEKKLAIEAIVAQESAVIAANEILPQQEISNEIKDEEKKVLEKTDNLEQLKPEKEKNLSDQKSDLEESNLKLEKDQIDDKITPEKVEEERLDEPKKDELLNDSDKKDKISENSDKNTDELRQNTAEQNQQQVTTQRPTIFEAAQQAISNSPIGQFIDSFRRPLSQSSTNSPPADQSQLVVTVPNLLQQFQAGVQNLTSQFTSVFNPNQVQQAADTGSTTRPTIIQTLQSNLQNAVNSVFRPLTVNVTSTGVTPQSPLQVVLNPLQAVQNFLSGNRGETSTSAKPITVVMQDQQQSNSQVTFKPISSSTVDDKLDYSVKNSQEEVIDSDEEHEQEDSEENSNPSNDETDEIQENYEQKQQQQQQQHLAINENQILQELAAQSQSPQQIVEQENLSSNT